MLGILIHYLHILFAHIFPVLQLFSNYFYFLLLYRSFSFYAYFYFPLWSQWKDSRSESPSPLICSCVYSFNICLSSTCYMPLGMEPRWLLSQSRESSEVKQHTRKEINMNKTISGRGNCSKGHRMGWWNRDRLSWKICPRVVVVTGSLRQYHLGCSMKMEARGFQGLAPRQACTCQVWGSETCSRMNPESQGGRGHQRPGRHRPSKGAWTPSWT